MKFITKNSSHSTVHIGMQEKCVEETVNTKFLGLQIDNHIKWKNYIDMIPELTLSLLMSCIYMELLVKPEILTLYIYIYIYIYIYMDLRLAMLKALSFYLLHNVSTLNQCRLISCVTFVCKHFAS